MLTTANEANLGKKSQEFKDYLIKFNIKETLEVANAFYVGYSTGYANSSEDAYNENDLQVINVDLHLKLESLQAQNASLLKRYSICTCKPMPYLDWCEKCTWAEVHRECDKGEKLEKELRSKDEIILDQDKHFMDLNSLIQRLEKELQAKDEQLRVASEALNEYAVNPDKEYGDVARQALETLKTMRGEG